MLYQTTTSTRQFTIIFPDGRLEVGLFFNVGVYSVLLSIIWIIYPNCVRLVPTKWKTASSSSNGGDDSFK